jgi:hypothetical protein
VALRGDGKPNPTEFDVKAGTPGEYKVTAILHYRKIDQFLLNYVLGEKEGQTAPVVEISRATAMIPVRRPGK